MRAIQKTAWCAGLLFAVSSAHEYDKDFDLSLIKTKSRLQSFADSETIIPTSLYNKQSMAPFQELIQAQKTEVVAESQPPALVKASIGDYFLWYDTDQFGQLSQTDWLWFSVGLTLGFFVTLSTTGLASVFNPCLAQWAAMIAASFYFYLYMTIYAREDFEGTSNFGFMILTFIQFGAATSQRACTGDDNNGFYKALFDNSPDTFRQAMDIQIRDIMNRATDPLVYLLTSMLGIYGQSGSDDQITAIVIVIGTQGFLLLFQAVESWNSSVENFEEEYYFESGSFLGKAIVEGLSVLYLFALAYQISQM